MSVRRPLLLPLVPLYRAGVSWKNRRYDRDGNAASTLRDPVVSVGALSAGGAGKTPFLLELAGLVRELGYAPDVLSRGYGRNTRGVLRVDPHGAAETFGDEPLLIARTLGCAVYVGERRYDAGVRAETELPDTGRGMHLLDDGFAHRRLARTVDIVLLTREDTRDSLLPAGNLREPLSSLRCADIIVVRANEAASVRPFVNSELRYARKTGRVWTVDRRMTLPATVPGSPLVFSGIARPADFERMIAERGIRAVAARRFRDHHRYTGNDIADLLRRAQATRANGWLTTPKDAVKLTGAMQTALGTVGPIAVADAVVTLRDRDRCAEDLRQLLRRRNRLAPFIVGPEAIP